MKSSRLVDHLDHIGEAATNACDFVAGMSKEAFLLDKRTQQAVVMSFIIIGEAATQAMEDHPHFVEKNASVPWRSMRGMRNRMAHGYFDLNLDVIWETVEFALPQLLKELPGIRARAIEP